MGLYYIHVGISSEIEIICHLFSGEIEAIDIGRLTVQGDNEGRVIGAKRSVKTNVVNPVVQSGYILDAVRPPYRTVDDL